MKIYSRKILMLMGLIGAISMLVYCGGGGGSGGSGGSSGGGSAGGTAVGVFFTDAPADQYPVVDITAYEINICSDNDCADKVNLYSDADGLSVDLARLNGVLQYITTAVIPEGTYNRLEIILGNKANIADNLGQAHDAFFAPMTEKPNKPNIVQCPQELNGKCYIRFNGAVQPLSTGKLVVDFMLKDFEVKNFPCNSAADLTSWCITEVKMRPITADSEISDLEFELHGMLTGKGAESLTVRQMGTDYTVNLTAGTVCEVTDVNFTGPADCLNNLALNTCLEVETLDDPASSTTITAVRIEASSSSRCGESGGGGERHQQMMLKGTVTKNADNFELDTFASPITVTANTMCNYAHAMQSMQSGETCFNDLLDDWTVGVKINSSNEAIMMRRED